MPPQPRPRVRPPPRSARTSRAHVVGTRVPAILQWGRHSKCRDSLTVGQEEPKAATGARVREGLAGAPERGRIPGAASGGGGRKEACGLCRVRCGHSGPPKPAGDPPAGPRRGGGLRGGRPSSRRRRPPCALCCPRTASGAHPTWPRHRPRDTHPLPGPRGDKHRALSGHPGSEPSGSAHICRRGAASPHVLLPSLCLPQAEQPPTLDGQSTPSPGPSLPLPRRLRPSSGPQCGTAAGSHPRTRPETDGNPSAVGRTASPRNPVRPERQNGTSLGNSPCRL